MSSKTICTCKNCDQLYCVECSRAEHLWEYCSEYCEQVSLPTEESER
jgi:hypothetical protein